MYADIVIYKPHDKQNQKKAIKIIHMQIKKRKEKKKAG